MVSFGVPSLAAGSIEVGRDISWALPVAGTNGMFEDVALGTDCLALWVLSTACTVVNAFASSTSPSSTSLLATGFRVDAPLGLRHC